MRSIVEDEGLIIGADFNGHVGKQNDGVEDVHGGYGYGESNPEGESTVQFAKAQGMCIANTVHKFLGADVPRLRLLQPPPGTQHHRCEERSPVRKDA